MALQGRGGTRVTGRATLIGDIGARLLEAERLARRASR